ncbi:MULTISPECIES: HAD family hydrolase [unclassified Paenibacillus]|uniref:HAD family hydrolase n=1 Tax=unclassified Paenibacillus TaxID=185978 RepID=UPI00020D733A|nr:MULTISPECIES: HAD family hydrolase [unclassified Paenibacillus]EGL13392.1 HAD hydrolase, family IA, variant 1 [Paenibacillus sp. HGF7]EPD81967.1 HAD hydrolase, family IA [Paenibacillus sp. HGH0039]
MPIQAVLFDFDGTLADTLPLSFDAFRRVFETYENVTLSDEQITAKFGPTEDDIIRLNVSDASKAPAAIEDYYSFYENHFHARVSMPRDIAHMLEDLSGQGVRMVIITGKSRRALDVSLNKLGIEKFFFSTVSGDEVDRPKPDPEGIFKALKLLGLSKEEAIFVGDSSADIKAGKSAGLWTIGAHWFETVQTALFSPEPDDVLTNVRDLVELVRQTRT